MTLRRFAIDAGSLVLWFAAWLTVGYDRSVRMVVAMLLILEASNLVHRGNKLWLAGAGQPEMTAPQWS